jgi:hypothetical protein
MTVIIKNCAEGKKERRTKSGSKTWADISGQRKKSVLLITSANKQGICGFHGNRDSVLT